jgi:hypothetical protein
MSDEEISQTEVCYDMKQRQQKLEGPCIQVRAFPLLFFHRNNLEIVSQFPR